MNHHPQDSLRRVLNLPVIRSTSPSLAEAMRTCLLRAALSRTPGVNAFVLGNPKAWLGIAYHAVLERLPELSAAGEGASVLIETIWNEEISRLEQEAAAHPLNRRFGQSTSWRGYFLALATVKLRAEDMLPSSQGEPSPSAPASRERVFREDDCTAFSGKLRGKPDLGSSEEIVDFKTGNLYEEDDGDSAPAVKQAYVRQLRIYAYLVHEATGKWARRGLLYPIAGPPVIVNLDPVACTTEAQEAVALLDQYNATVAKSEDHAALASPAPDACRWCPYQAICPAFWMVADESWADTLAGEALGGRLQAAPQAVHGGTAYALSLAVDSGTIERVMTSISPFPAAIHDVAAELSSGDRVRIVGLRRGKNEALFPTLRTVLVPESSVPVIQMPSEGDASGAGPKL